MNKQLLIEDLERRYKGVNFGIQENEYFTFLIYDNIDIYNKNKEEFVNDIIEYLKLLLNDKQKHRLVIKYDLLKEMKCPKHNNIVIRGNLDGGII